MIEEVERHMALCRKLVNAPDDDVLYSSIERLQALVKEIMDEHSDVEDPGYNKCDTEPCAWCEEAAELMPHD